MLKVFDEIRKHSGHSINRTKSQVFFSLNVEESLANSLSLKLGILRCDDLDKYLGVPLHAQESSKSTYAPLLDKLAKKVQNGDHLRISLVGRSTLASRFYPLSNSI
ncbi:hypothetical protein Syun_021007 [Stephania yunnanensis]|uniref:Reverse transcriptase domain-containing protein n=1 Tax=Stephania yunnanensis TaxID=152371 RepID=A0AAP0IFK6_9MAGN